MKRMNRNVTVGLVASFAAACLIVSIAAQSQATPIVTQSPYQTTAFAVSSTDLINGLLPTAISHTDDHEGLSSDTTGKALTDGTFGPNNPYQVGASSSMTIVNNSASITYASLSFFAEIDSYSGWQDGGRSQQQYTVSVSTNGIGYSLLATVNATQDPYAPPPPAHSPSDDKVAITGSTGILASPIKFVQFNFPSVEKWDASG